MRIELKEIQLKELDGILKTFEKLNKEIYFEKLEKKLYLCVR
jgi:hypothetical protein